MSVRFKCWQYPTGQKGMILLKVDEEDKNVLDWVTSFFKEKLEKERKKDEPLPLIIELDYWKPLRTPNQWGLAMELLDRYCAKTRQDRKNVWAGVKYATFPDVGEIGKRVKKSSGDLATTEMSAVVDYLIQLCDEASVDTRDIWTIHQKQRYRYGGEPTKQEKGDLLKCEACGKVLNAGTDAAGNQQIAGQQAHIVSKGAGGPDEDWNTPWLCTDCHMLTQHQMGWDKLLAEHPEFEDRYNYAREKFRESQQGDQKTLDLGEPEEQEIKAAYNPDTGEFEVPPDFG